MIVDADAEDIFLGDLVNIETDGNVNVISAVTGVILGSVVGVLPVTPPDPQDTLALAGSTEVPLARKYSAGAGVVLVCTAPDAIYETETTLAANQTNVGSSCNVSITAGDTTTGLSKQVANTVVAAQGTSEHAQLKIVAIAPKMDNDTAAVNTKVYVTINKHFFAKNSAGV